MAQSKRTDKWYDGPRMTVIETRGTPYTAASLKAYQDIDFQIYQSDAALEELEQDFEDGEEDCRWRAEDFEDDPWWDSREY